MTTILTIGNYDYKYDQFWQCMLNKETSFGLSIVYIELWSVTDDLAVIGVLISFGRVLITVGLGIFFLV